MYKQLSEPGCSCRHALQQPCCQCPGPHSQAWLILRHQAARLLNNESKASAMTSQLRGLPWRQILSFARDAATPSSGISHAAAAMACHLHLHQGQQLQGHSLIHGQACGCQHQGNISAPGSDRSHGGSWAAQAMQLSTSSVGSQASGAGGSQRDNRIEFTPISKAVALLVSHDPTRDRHRCVLGVVFWAWWPRRAVAHCHIGRCCSLQGECGCESKAPAVLPGSNLLTAMQSANSDCHLHDHTKYSLAFCSQSMLNAANPTLPWLALPP